MLQGIRHEKIIIDATALGELKGATIRDGNVVVDADLMQRRIGPDRGAPEARQ